MFLDEFKREVTRWRQRCMAVGWRWHSPDLGRNAGLCQPITLPWNLCSRQDWRFLRILCQRLLQSKASVAWRGSGRHFGALCRMRGWPRYPWYVYINSEGNRLKWGHFWVCSWEERQTLSPVFVIENHYIFLWKLSTHINFTWSQDFDLVVFL